MLFFAIAPYLLPLPPIPAPTPNPHVKVFFFFLNNGETSRTTKNAFVFSPLFSLSFSLPLTRSLEMILSDSRDVFVWDDFSNHFFQISRMFLFALLIFFGFFLLHPTSLNFHFCFYFFFCYKYLMNRIPGLKRSLRLRNVTA